MDMVNIQIDGKPYTVPKNSTILEAARIAGIEIPTLCYFKKITPQSLRMSGEQKYKEGDGPGQQAEATNAAEVMFFTDRCQVYKTRLSEFGDSKASVLGDYLPAKLGMDEGESVVHTVGEVNRRVDIQIVEQCKIASITARS